MRLKGVDVKFKVVREALYLVQERLHLGRALSDLAHVFDFFSGVLVLDASDQIEGLQLATAVVCELWLLCKVVI